jgi:hypothetical protein
MKTFLSATVLAVALTLSACGSDVPQDVVDTNMGITRSNAQKNADVYFSTVYPSGSTDVRLGDPIRAQMQSDSTVSKTCRYGDGWASGVINFQTGKTLSIKCQTNGNGKGINGCMTSAEFGTKTYKDEEGSCQNLESLVKAK